MGIISASDWDKVNWSTKIWGLGAADPPAPTVLNCSDPMNDYSVLQWAAKAYECTLNCWYIAVRDGDKLFPKHFSNRAAVHCSVVNYSTSLCNFCQITCFWCIHSSETINILAVFIWRPQSFTALIARQHYALSVIFCNWTHLSKIIQFLQFCKHELSWLNRNESYSFGSKAKLFLLIYLNWIYTGPKWPWSTR